MNECLYHQRGNEIFYKGKCVIICYGDSDCEKTNSEEACERARIIAVKLNYAIEMENL